MPGAWRAGGLQLFTRCQLGLGRLDAAQAAADRCAQLADEVGLRYARAQAARAAGAVALAAGEADVAAERTLAAATELAALQAPVQEAQTRVLAGRALAVGGDRGGAIAQFERAAEVFEACGAPRRRDEAERELRRLGRGLPPLGGERARVADRARARDRPPGRRPPDQHADSQAALFLSKKTVETHLRNIFGKVGVSCAWSSLAWSSAATSCPDSTATIRALPARRSRADRCRRSWRSRGPPSPPGASRESRGRSGQVAPRRDAAGAP